MHNAIVVFNQVVVMFLIAAVGYILVQCKKFEPAITKSLSNILLYVVTPSVIISSMQREYKAEEANGFFAALILAVILHILFGLLAPLFIRNKPENKNIGMERFASMMANTGYIGIPMVQAVLGTDGVFFITAYIIAFNLYMFSYGRIQLCQDHERRTGETGKYRIRLIDCFINPASVALVIGFVLYTFQIRLPQLVMSVLDGFYSLNTPLSMLIIGVFFSQVSMQSILRAKRAILISVMKLILFPLIAMVLLAVVDLSWLVPDAYMLKSSLFIAVCTPTAVSASFTAELYGADSLYGTKLVALSTILSIITMPLMFLLWEMIPKF